MADGYAINEVGGGGILVDTVHTSRRAAIVNWLVTRKNVMVTADRDDSWIEFMWKHLRGERDFCIKIEIHAVQGAGANVTDGASVDFTGLDAALDELRKPVDEVRE